MKSFNLSEWALDHRSFVYFLMLVSVLMGGLSYTTLGRQEDPDFTIKTMVVYAQWPGATAAETAEQLTERIEDVLEQLPELNYTESTTTDGAVTVSVNLRENVQASAIPQVWIQVRNLVTSIAPTFPEGVQGPYFNDRFGDVFGNIYAFTADDLTPRQLQDYVEAVREKVLTIPDAGRTELMGVQSEVIYLEYSLAKLSSYGIDQQTFVTALQEQNAISPTGEIEAEGDRVSVRVSGSFQNEAAIRDLTIRVGDRFVRMGDILTISRGYVDPPSPIFRVDGKSAIGLAIGMRAGANLESFGKTLEQTMAEALQDLPLGVDVTLVANQPEVVEEAISHFIKALLEAVAIVLAVSFVSLGLRAGMVVALAIPLCLAVTFIAMQYLGISFQRISLGGLIIALGLLVDDAMIAVEMMIARLEVGDNLRKAATYVYTSTAFPMLTGTLVTVASFMPMGLNSSSAGEFVYSLFIVIAVSLTASWVVAVLFTPLLGVLILPATLKKKHKGPGAVTRAFAAVLRFCMYHRWLTILACVAALVWSVFMLGSVKQEFFPASDRRELIVDFNLPKGSSIKETEAQMTRFEQEQLVGNADIEHWTSFIGSGGMRFMLSFEPEGPNPYYGQIVIVTHDLKARDRLRPALQEWLRTELPGTDALVRLLDIGPPSGRPVQYRISGPDVNEVQRIARDLAAVVGKNAHVGQVTFDWNEPIRVLKIDVLQDNAARLGVTSQDIASAINGAVAGVPLTQLRDGTYLIDVIARATAADRNSIETLRNLQIARSGAEPVPLSSVARFRYTVEPPVIAHRQGAPSLTVAASILGAVQPATVVSELTADIDAFSSQLPLGYILTLGGVAEDSAQATAPIIAVVPIMLFVMFTLLMIQLQSFMRLFIVFAVAPLGLIGVVAAMLISGAPLGFVAIFGVLALIGILIRNSVILVVQIEHLREEGLDAWTAVAEATEHRMRPIVLTAAAASLGLIPIAFEVFWGPMAYAMMGGIIVGTVLTLLFLPALYLACLRIPKPTESSNKHKGGEATAVPHAV